MDPFKENKNFVQLFELFSLLRLIHAHIQNLNILRIRLESVNTIVNMAKLTLLLILILFMVISTSTAMNPLSDIVKKCFGHHKLLQFNYMLGQIDDDSLLNMADIFRENQEECVGSLEW